MTNGIQQGVVWDNPTTYTVLDGGAGSLNPAGTVVVGQRNGSPAYWFRTASGSWTTTGTNLPALGGSCGGGLTTSINGAGLISGSSCRTSKGSGSVATVWQLDLSGGTPVLLGPPLGLGGVGPGAHSSVAVAITLSPPYVVMGYIENGQNVAVRWSLP